MQSAFILFASSVAAVRAWPNTSNPIPEEPIHDFNAAQPMGYGQSKLLCECLLDSAANVSAVNSASCRIGVIAGPVRNEQGQWSRHDFIPAVWQKCSMLQPLDLLT